MITLHECVDKQYGKLPISRERGRKRICWCPRCGDLLLTKIDGAFVFGKMAKYCCECGQKIDWSF